MHHCQSHFTGSVKGILDRLKTPKCRDYPTFFTELHSDLLVMPEVNNDGGKRNVLEIEYFIFVCRELDLV